MEIAKKLVEELITYIMQYARMNNISAQAIFKKKAQKKEKIGGFEQRIFYIGKIFSQEGLDTFLSIGKEVKGNPNQRIVSTRINKATPIKITLNMGHVIDDQTPQASANFDAKNYLKQYPKDRIKKMIPGMLGGQAKEFIGILSGPQRAAALTKIAELVKDQSNKSPTRLSDGSWGTQEIKITIPGTPSENGETNFTKLLEQMFAAHPGVTRDFIMKDIFGKARIVEIIVKDFAMEANIDFTPLATAATQNADKTGYVLYQTAAPNFPVKEAFYFLKDRLPSSSEKDMRAIAQSGKMNWPIVVNGQLKKLNEDSLDAFIQDAKPYIKLGLWTFRFVTKDRAFAYNDKGKRIATVTDPDFIRYLKWCVHLILSTLYTKSYSKYLADGKTPADHMWSGFRKNLRTLDYQGILTSEGLFTNLSLSLKDSNGETIRKSKKLGPDLELEDTPATRDLHNLEYRIVLFLLNNAKRSLNVKTFKLPTLDKFTAPLPDDQAMQANIDFTPLTVRLKQGKDQTDVVWETAAPNLLLKEAFNFLRSSLPDVDKNFDQSVKKGEMNWPVNVNGKKKNINEAAVDQFIKAHKPFIKLGPWTFHMLPDQKANVYSDKGQQVGVITDKHFYQYLKWYVQTKLATLAWALGDVLATGRELPQKHWPGFVKYFNVKSTYGGTFLPEEIQINLPFTAPIRINRSSLNVQTQNSAQEWTIATTTTNNLKLLEAKFNLFLIRSIIAGFAINDFRLPTDEELKNYHTEVFKDEMMAADVGGIDFNPQKMDLQETGSRINFSVSTDLQYLENVQVLGIHPVIINITPVTNFPLLLGLKKEGLSPQLSYSVN